MHLLAGQGFTYTCHFSNAGTETVSFGTGTNGDMCAAFAFFTYPDGHESDVPPRLLAPAFADGAVVAGSEGASKISTNLPF